MAARCAVHTPREPCSLAVDQLHSWTRSAVQAAHADYIRRCPLINTPAHTDKKDILSKKNNENKQGRQELDASAAHSFDIETMTESTGLLRGRRTEASFCLSCSPLHGLSSS